MHKNNFFVHITETVIVIALALLSACSVNVKKEPNGQDKQVDINTLIGGIHVSKQADAADVGVAIYPGARLKEDDADGSDKSANVNISGFGFALKVVALSYESDDPSTKLVAFYREQLKKYGDVKECHTSGHFKVDTNVGTHGSKKTSTNLTCDGGQGENIELKAGKEGDEHIVAIEPQGKGSSFSLVYVRTHGRDADI